MVSVAANAEKRDEIPVQSAEVNKFIHFIVMEGRDFRAADMVGGQPARLVDAPRRAQNSNSHLRRLGSHYALLGRTRVERSDLPTFLLYQIIPGNT